MPTDLNHTTRLLAGLFAVIMCPSGPVSTWGQWPSSDPCPQIEAGMKWLAKCGPISTSGTAIVTGDEPCPKKETNNHEF